MTARFLVSAAIALVAIGYLVIEFGRLVIDDASTTREAGQDAGYDAETVTWVQHLNGSDAEFDAWCAQAIALTREPADADLQLWEHELKEGSS